MEGARDDHGVDVVVAGGLDPGLDRAERVPDHDHMLEGVAVHRACAQGRDRVVQRHRAGGQVEFSAWRVGAVAVPDAVDVEGGVPGCGRGFDVGVVAAAVGEVPVQVVVGGAVHQQLHRGRLPAAAVAQLPPHGLVGRPGIGDPHRQCVVRAGQFRQPVGARARGRRKSDGGQRGGGEGESEASTATNHRASSASSGQPHW